MRCILFIDQRSKWWLSVLLGYRWRSDIGAYYRRIWIEGKLVGQTFISGSKTMVVLSGADAWRMTEWGHVIISV